MRGFFTRMGEKMGIITPIPVLNTPETNTSTPGVSHTSQKVIEQYKKALEKQQEVIDSMETENIKFSRVIAALSLSVGIILGGAGVSVVNQASPDNFMQKISSKVAKLLGAEMTAYDYLGESNRKDALLTEQKGTLEVYKQLVGAQGELLKAKDDRTNILIQKIENFSSDIQELKESLTLHASAKPVTGKIIPIPSVSPMENKKTVFDQVSEYVSVLNQNKLGAYQIKFSQNDAGRVLVWVEGNGKRSLGYYADSPKYTQRLSLSAMKNWANQNTQELEHIGHVYQIAQEKGLPRNISQSHLFSIQAHQQYSGGVKVTIRDNASNKIVSFTTMPRESDQTISNKIDKITDGFLS